LEQLHQGFATSVSERVGAQRAELMELVAAAAEEAGQQRRRLNVIMRGMPMHEWETTQQLVQRISELLGGAAVTVVAADRIGKLRRGGHPPPVRVTLQSIQLVHAAYKVRSEGIRIGPDLSPAQRQRRRDLSPAWEALRELGLDPRFRGGVLTYVSPQGGQRREWNDTTPPTAAAFGSDPDSTPWRQAPDGHPSAKVTARQLSYMSAPVEVLDTFRYLGVDLHSTAQFAVSSADRAASAQRAALELHNRCRDLRLHDPTLNMHLFDARVIP